ncbi:hypothetical protein CCP3SC1AL1_570002 [Gammaproteobacteria bacterium]
MSKYYTFKISRGEGYETFLHVSEDSLTFEQKELLLAEAIKNYKELPKSLKEDFLRKNNMSINNVVEDDDLPF